MTSRGRLVEKRSTPMPQAFICQYENREHLQLTVRLDDPRRYLHRSLETADWTEASMKFGMVYTELLGNPDEKARVHSVHINKLLDQFDSEQLSRVRRNEITEGTHKSKSRTLFQGFLPYCNHLGIKRVSDIEGTTFKHYGEWRHDVYHYQQGTINTEIRHLKEFLIWCQKSKGHFKGEHWLVPTLRQTKGSVKETNRAYTDEMVEEITDYLLEKQNDQTLSIHQRWLWKQFTLFWTLQLDCGCRTAEFTHVQWKDVQVRGYNPERPDTILEVINSVHIPESKTGPRDIVFQSPVLIQLREIYKEKGITLTPDSYVFLNTLNGKKISPQGFNRKWKDMSEELGYGPEYSLYSTRSTYITDRIINGTPLSMIAQNAGNSSRMLESRYRDIIMKTNTRVMTQRAGLKDDDTEFRSLVG